MSHSMRRQFNIMGLSMSHGSLYLGVSMWLPLPLQLFGKHQPYKDGGFHFWKQQVSNYHQTMLSVKQRNALTFFFHFFFLLFFSRLSQLFWKCPRFSSYNLHITEQDKGFALCMLGTLAYFFVVCCFFFKINFFEKFFQEYIIRVSNSLDPDQARHFVGLIWI